VTLVVAGVLFYLIRRLARSRAEFRIGVPVAIGVGLRLAAIAGIGATGLSSTLRGGDETTFVALATQPLGHGDLPHGPSQLQTVLFALRVKLGFLNQAARRITQVGIAMLESRRIYPQGWAAPAGIVASRAGRCTARVCASAGSPGIHV
jgi:hypothetical protein